MTGGRGERPAPSLSASVDLHCHLLPGIDDGARDLDDAIAMARQAEADGIPAICATPHIRHDHDVRIAELPERRAELGRALTADGCSTRVLGGGEVAVGALDGLCDSELVNLSLGGGGCWVLLEPDPGPLAAALDRAVDRLHRRGFRALIAHPERHLAPDLLQRLTRLAGRGALVQATAAFLLHDATSDGMLALARSGLIHVLGSDSHSARAGRPVAIAAALEVLGTVEPTASNLDWIARAGPEGIARGDDLTPPF
ncbi:MAG TPA: CpsB/CapC family capsule biosynthesis tyrosine phosphatase [Solirubrobacteraceae bacterium]|nr:CpsB/CapC family capsule biosynthesis tyrosine phosphatase [Solirubrobacteraceae bacterium]